jgi:dipeptidyl-peptidase-4
MMYDVTASTFPRQHARTRHFTLGVPRNFTLSPDGDRLLFLRTRTGSDPTSLLFVMEVTTGSEVVVADPVQLLGGVTEELSAAERAQRERSREQSGGIVSYSTDRAVRRVVFSLSGALYRADLDSAQCARLSVPGPVLDARLDPSGARIAYVGPDGLTTIGWEDAEPVVIAAPEAPTVTYGLAEFVAAEEMGRDEGMWWSPDGSRLLVARVDLDRVETIFLSDPAAPERPPTAVRYPAVGTPNADVSLVLIDLDGGRLPVDWDRVGYEYLVAADYSGEDPLIVTESRDQRSMQLLRVDHVSGKTTVIREEKDDCWVDIIPGVPVAREDGTVVWSVNRDGSHRLLVGDKLVTPAGLELRSVLGVDRDIVLFSASSEPTEIDLFTYDDARGLIRHTSGGGVFSGHLRGRSLLVTGRTLQSHGTTTVVYGEGVARAQVPSLAEEPILRAHPFLGTVAESELRVAVLFPRDHREGSAKLPVLLDPYGGPHGQRVLAARDAYLVSQWFADQGFAVVIADGRGTPGRGSVFERSIHGDFATPVLEDQIEALHGVAAVSTDLDLSRVAIRGWSFGGYLAALAVLRRPDIFHAGIAGAPVTEHRLYDTHYMERYLGQLDHDAANYDRCSLLGDAKGLDRPLMLIHGLVDDNVLVAHSLALSGALLAAGRPHTFLPLSGVTHMTPDEIVAENLLLLQLAFLRQALGLDDRSRGPA